MTDINLKSLLRENSYLRPLISTLAIYSVFVYLLTLNPFRFSLIYFNQFIQFRKGYLAAIIGGSSGGDIILNIIMLLPVGLVVGSLLRMLGINVNQSIKIATGLGFLISLSIECCQIFLPRSFSGVDMLANTVGALLGARLAYPFMVFDIQHILKQLYDKGRVFYVQVIFIYCVVATIILLIPAMMNTFLNWNSRFPLLIGNEATLNRPWEGIIYKLSIFNRKLKRHEIERLSKLDFKSKTVSEFSRGLLIEYIFENTMVKTFGALKDRLAFDAPENDASVLNRPAGVILNDNPHPDIRFPATELVHSLQKNNQLSIAIWLQPNSLRQGGPARIVSLSKDPDHRNFTLAQLGATVNFRVRTPLTGLNGTKVDLISSPILKEDKPQFVVATFHRGEQKLFNNGKLISPMIYNTSHYLPLLAGLSRDRFGKAAFCFMLLFPLGWLSRGLVISKHWKSIASSLVIFIPLLVSSMITTIFWGHTFDLHLFFFCCSIALILIVIGALYDLI